MNDPIHDLMNSWADEIHAEIKRKLGDDWAFAIVLRENGSERGHVVTNVCADCLIEFLDETADELERATPVGAMPKAGHA